MTELRNRHARRSLRGRLAWWMLSSTLFTLAAFAAIAYTQVVLEAREPLADDQGEKSGPAEDASEQVFHAMLLAAPLCVALSVGGALWLSRRALSPLTRVIADAEAMSAQDLHKRLQVPEHDDELRDLTQALNGLLGRLDEGFQALGSYAAAASHELRTPLAVIVSELEIALRRPRSPEEWQRIATTSLDEARRLAKLVEALLDLSRADASSPEQLETVDLSDVVDQALSALAAHAPQDAGRVDAVGAHAPTWVCARPVLLLSAIQELLRNGLRYSPATGRIQIIIERASPSSVALHVDDCGPGIAPAEQLAIFEPFIRGEQGRTADRNMVEGQRGLGLGLAMVKRSIESCEGTVSIGKAPSGGARFTLQLRAAPLG